MSYILLVFGLLLLIGGGNILVDGSVNVAKRFKVSSLLIGLLFIGFGTSLPELSTSLISVARKVDGIAIGTVLGSNIANILLVLGVAAILRPIKIHPNSFGRDAIFLGVSTIVLLVSVLKGSIGWELGALMCMTLAFYVYHAYKTDKNHMKGRVVEPQRIVLSRRFHMSTPLAVVLTVCGLVLMLFGAHLVVNSVVVLAGHWGISETVIGLTVVAFGTSLPELVTSIIASVKNHSEVAVGNVVGSNIYNALFILGFTSLFLPVIVPPSVKVDMLVMAATTMLLLAIGWGYGKISRRMGWCFISMYCMYIVYLGMQ